MDLYLGQKHLSIVGIGLQSNRRGIHRKRWLRSPLASMMLPHDGSNLWSLDKGAPLRTGLLW